MKKSVLLIATVLLSLSAYAQQLWYDQPATQWLEALPIGNSHMGAMIYGGADTEHGLLQDLEALAYAPSDKAYAFAQELGRALESLAYRAPYAHFSLVLW